MDPASDLATDLRLAQQVRNNVNAICSDLSAEARRENNNGRSSIIYELTRNFDLDCDLNTSQTFIYGMIIEELENKGYKNIKITPPTSMNNKVFIEFTWQRDLGEGEIARYHSIISRHAKR